ncbi:hypothetical protein ACFLZV_01315 [Candidatus Margulisiibacteriota bacterium]
MKKLIPFQNPVINKPKTPTQGKPNNYDKDRIRHNLKNNNLEILRTLRYKYQDLISNRTKYKDFFEHIFTNKNWTSSKPLSNDDFSKIRKKKLKIIDNSKNILKKKTPKENKAFINSVILPFLLLEVLNTNPDPKVISGLINLQKDFSYTETKGLNNYSVYHLSAFMRNKNLFDFLQKNNAPGFDQFDSFLFGTGEDYAKLFGLIKVQKPNTINVINDKNELTQMSRQDFEKLHDIIYSPWFHCNSHNFIKRIIEQKNIFVTEQLGQGGQIPSDLKRIIIGQAELAYSKLHSAQNFIVAYIPEIKGYGLYANRVFEENEFIDFLGGMIVAIKHLKNAKNNQFLVCLSLIEKSHQLSTKDTMIKMLQESDPDGCKLFGSAKKLFDHYSSVAPDLIKEKETRIKLITCQSKAPFWVNMKKQRNLTAFINCSKYPNTRLLSTPFRGVPGTMVYATKKILQYEQFLVGFSSLFEENKIENFFEMGKGSGFPRFLTIV